MLNRISTIVLGVEAFTEKREHLEQALHALAWFNQPDLKVFLVSVLSSDNLGVDGDFEDSYWLNRTKEKAMKDLRARVQSIDIKANFEIQILVQKESTKSKIVESFLEFAAQKNADLLILHSHTKSNLKSSLGSFCHQLVNQSQIPLLVLPFNQIVPDSLNEILFPTDFSGLSELVFRSVMKWADSYHFHVTLYHRITRPIDELLQVAMHPIQSKMTRPEDLFFVAEEDIRRKAHQWIHGASNEVRKVSFKMDAEKNTLPAAILDRAERQNASLIALPTHTSQGNVPSFGSTVSHVLRSSLRPVLIIPVNYVPPGDFSL